MSDIQVLRISHPPLNVLSVREGVVAKLDTALRAARQSATVRAVVIAGSGSHFSAGADIADFDEDPQSSNAIRSLMSLVESFPKPLVMAIDGLCLGAGLLFLHTALGLDRRSGHRRAAPRFLLMLAWIGVNTAVGLALVVAPTALVPIFPPGDVRLGGAMMGVVGDGAMLMIMAAMAASSRRAARLSEPGRCPVCEFRRRRSPACGSEETTR